MLSGLTSSTASPRRPDQGFISVSAAGDVLVSGRLNSDERRLLGLEAPLRVRRLDDGHRRYLLFHRERLFQGDDAA